MKRPLRDNKPVGVPTFPPAGTAEDLRLGALLRSRPPAASGGGAVSKEPYHTQQTNDVYNL
ncbi:uncharacterized protein LOC62_01G001770 [Vanrija pseudolonga]|uniref:Uncharacterized protein n=1 Tax=Vanrija pseudolonga TaxID=143232 RepID=A0AAF0Y526_9TREE|nr:hypothetical protein LOC62_01G001770 [Vanrija pseudolonga]